MKREIIARRREGENDRGWVIGGRAVNFRESRSLFAADWSRIFDPRSRVQRYNARNCVYTHQGIVEIHALRVTVTAGGSHKTTRGLSNGASHKNIRLSISALTRSPTSRRSHSFALFPAAAWQIAL